VHESISKAITAEQLMRSRFSAFVFDNMSFLRLSHAKATIGSFNFKSVSKWTKSVKWLKLEILETQKGQNLDDYGYVEFKAFFLENGKIDYIHGKSEFIKQNNHWVYLDEL
jgi:SEC-C motif-containing protein